MEELYVDLDDETSPISRLSRAVFFMTLRDHYGKEKYANLMNTWKTCKNKKEKHTFYASLDSACFEKYEENFTQELITIVSS